MPTVENVSLGGGQVAMLQKATSLTSAQIQVLNGTPITLVTAPGAGFLNLFFFAALVFNFGTVAYQTNSGPDTLTIKYGGVGGVTLASTVGALLVSAQSDYDFRPVINNGGNILPGPDNQAIILSALANYQKGPIATTTLNAAGTGYAVNDTGTVTTGTADATYIITSIGAGGSVTGYTITSGGTGYLTGTGIATATGGAQPGVGTGFKVNIVTVTVGDGTLKVTAFYQVIAVP